MIDIVLASKNQIKFVGDTISSLKKQTYQNYKLICIDGYSDDGTDEVLKNFSKATLYYSDKDVQIAYLEGILHCDSKYIAFNTTSDYYICDSWLENAHSILEADENIDIIWGSGIDISEDGEFLGENLTSAKKAFPNGYRGTIDNYLLSDFYIPELSYIIRRDLLFKIIEENNLREKIFTEKKRYEIWFYIVLSLLKKESIIYFIPKNVFAGRVHSNSVTNRLKSSAYKKNMRFQTNAMYDFIIIIAKKLLQNNYSKNLLSKNISFNLKYLLFILKYIKYMIKKIL